MSTEQTFLSELLKTCEAAAIIALAPIAALCVEFGHPYVAVACGVAVIVGITHYFR